MGAGRVAWRLAAVLLAGLLAAGCSSSPLARRATPTPIPTPVAASSPTYTVARGPVVAEVKFAGRVSPVQEELLFFRTDGRVTEVRVQAGQRVRAGEVLAQLETSDLLVQLAQARLSLQQAQTRLASVERAAAEANTQLQIALETARLRLAQARVRDPAHDVTIAAINRDKAAAAVQAAQAAYDLRVQRPGASASPEALNLQRATWDYELAKTQYQKALEAQQAAIYEIMILEQNVHTAELNLEKARYAVDPILSQEVAKAQLSVDRLNDIIARAQLVAPVDGEVTLVSIVPGRSISAFQTAIALATTKDLEVSATLTDEAVSRLSVGQACLVTLVYYPGQVFHGRIRRLPYLQSGGGDTRAALTELDRSVRVAIEEPVRLERGWAAQVTVPLAQRDGVLWLPPAAARTYQGKSFVVVEEGVNSRRVPVRVGVVAEDRVEILEGLSEGQVVIGP